MTSPKQVPQINPGTKAIFNALAERRAQSSKPGNRTDNKHIALLIEGGGMIGVNAGGFVSAIEELGLTDCFDSVHGSSAGAAAGAYLLAGQARLGTSIFYEDITDSRFIKVSRFLLNQAIMDTSYLVDDVMSNSKKLDFTTMKERGIPLFISSTDIDRDEAVTHSHFSNFDDFRHILKASMAIPFVAGHAARIAGKRLLDGGLVEQFGIRSAIEVGATHALVLFTRREIRLKRTVGTIKLRAQAAFLGAQYGGRMREIFNNRHPRINSDIDLVLAGGTKTTPEFGYITLAPGVTDLKRLTTDPERLKQAAEESRRHFELAYERATEGLP